MINEIQVVADFTQICYNKILFPINNSNSNFLIDKNYFNQQASMKSRDFASTNEAF